MNIEEILKKLPPTPVGIDKWIRKGLVKNTYIIYSKKENKAVCTRCGHTFKADRFYMNHNGQGECPRCHEKATYKAAGIGRKNLAEYLRVLIFTHRGNTVYATLTEVEIDFSPAGKPDLNIWLSAAYMFAEKEQVYFKHHPGWMFGGEHWEERKNIKLPGLPPTHNWYSQNKWYRTEVYEENLQNVFEKSCLKYLHDRDLFDTYEFAPEDYIRYISLGLKYQSIELLSKAGFDRLVADKIAGCCGSGAVNWRASSLQKILRLPKRHIRFLREYNPDLKELAVFQALNEKEKQSTSWNDVEHLSSIDQRALKEISKYTSPLKWSRYAESQQRKYYFSNDWLDYINACNKLGMDITAETVLFPEDFQKAHDQALAKLEIQNDKERNEKILKQTFDISIERNGLVAIMARSQQSLNKESQSLNHCVRTYGDKIINGTSYIFFIRKPEEKEKPFYTMEVDSKGKVLQCRGKSNRSMTEEVQEFVNSIEKELKTALSKLSKERSIA